MSLWDKLKGWEHKRKLRDLCRRLEEGDDLRPILIDLLIWLDKESSR